MHMLHGEIPCISQSICKPGAGAVIACSDYLVKVHWKGFFGVNIMMPQIGADRDLSPLSL